MRIILYYITYNKDNNISKKFVVVIVVVVVEEKNKTKQNKKRSFLYSSKPRNEGNILTSKDRPWPMVLSPIVFCPTTLDDDDDDNDTMVAHVSTRAI